MKKRQTRRTSLRKGFLGIVILCWMIPVLTISSVSGVRYQQSMAGKIETLMQDELMNFMALTVSQIEECITISKKLSYDGVIENTWWNLQENQVSGAQFYRVVMGELQSRFYNDRRFRMAAFFPEGEPGEVYSVSGAGAGEEGHSLELAASEAAGIRKADDSYAHLTVAEGRLYLSRNLYTTTEYTRFGTLVLELNPERLFSGVTRSPQTEIVLYFNGDWGQSLYADDMTERERAGSRKLQEIYRLGEDQVLQSGSRGGFRSWIYQQQGREYHLAAAMLVEAGAVTSEWKAMRLMLVLLVAAFLPVLYGMVYLTYRHISKPAGELSGGFRQLESGGFGVHLAAEEMPNEEFQELSGSFNRMSDELKYLFETVYKEKLARKDAAIIALQSQINPHFLNNTLEMMNWQARISGDTVVSKMIEALATLLDYSMDRRNRKMISVAEELRCADAYFYIISMRFGQRLQIGKEIADELMRCEVPRLILQPLLENAVFHGVEKKNQGRITLRVYREENELVLKVSNTGDPLTEEEKEHIREILENPADGKTRTRISIGIRNVNERIRLIYGESYGLSIFSEENGETSSMIRIPWNRMDGEETT